MAEKYPQKPIQLLPLTRFIGGLNYHADAFQLSSFSNESPDLLNVDLDPRGGFSMRSGVGTLNVSALANPARNIWQYYNGSGVNQVVIHNSVGTTNQIAYSTGGNFTTVTVDSLTCTGLMRAVTFKNLNYIQRDAQQVAFKWDGTTATVLGTTFNDDFTNPTGTNMPKARFIASHAGSVWVANTVEGGTAFTSRVRWSHPNQPADFRTNDFIDINIGHDGDQITGVMPFGSNLLVFKGRSCYVITGFDYRSYNVQPLSQSVGCVGQEAMCVSPWGAYFFSWADGVMHYDGKTGAPAWERLWPAIADGRVLGQYQAGITLQWINQRLWVSVPWVSGSTNGRVFVLDPILYIRRRYAIRLGVEGGWTAYDIPLGPMLEWKPPGQTARYLGCHPTLNYIVQMNVGTSTDNFGSGAVNIASYYTTLWSDAGNPAQLKRWKRPEIILRGGQSATLRADIFLDYDSSFVKRSYTFSTQAKGTPLVWDDGTHSANMKWDNNVWGSDSTTSEVIVKLSVLGRARAVQLKITGPMPSVPWSLDSLTYKYLPLRIRP